MKYFLSYKFTGVLINKLHDDIDPIIELFKKYNHDIFCNLYYDDYYIKNKYTIKQIMDHCFDEIDQCDICLLFIDDILSGGMAIECGYACGKNKKIIALIPNNGSTFTTLCGISDKNIYYDSKNANDIYNKIEQYLKTL